MPQDQDIAMPRWALPLGETTWRRMNEMLDAGHGNLDIVRELGIPADKVRSLQVYARKFGPRRRLIRFGAFKDALLSGAGEFGSDFVKGLGRMAFLAVSNKTESKVQVKAMGEMNAYVRTLGELMKVDAQAEEQRAREDVGGKRRDAGEILEEVRRIYGIGDRIGSDGSVEDGRIRDGGGDG